ncbi:MAG TPA: hypothetical protein VFP39_16365 [Gemmatimonadales bacterium]|nr:hypothetical protein [Gemmatimonadales bacterium]
MNLFQGQAMFRLGSDNRASSARGVHHLQSARRDRQETTLSTKALLYAAGALALAACSPPTEPTVANHAAEALLVQPGLVQVRVDTEVAFVRYTSNSRNIFTAHADGSAQTQLTFGDGAVSQSPGFSRDGSRIAFAHEDDLITAMSIQVMNSSGSGVTTLEYAPLGYQDDEPTWGPPFLAPWGDQIAFTRYNANRTRSDIYKIRGSATTGTWAAIALTNNGVSAKPAWSPDGSKIAYVSQGAGCGKGIYLMNPDGTAQTRWSPCGLDADMPAWSPDGLKIAFVNQNVTEICVANVNAGGVLTFCTSGLEFPIERGKELAWYPDGTKIAFGKEGVIYALRLSDGQISPLINIFAGAWMPTVGVVTTKQF